MAKKNTITSVTCGFNTFTQSWGVGEKVVVVLINLSVVGGMVVDVKEVGEGVEVVENIVDKIFLWFFRRLIWIYTTAKNQYQEYQRK